MKQIIPLILAFGLLTKSYAQDSSGVYTPAVLETINVSGAVVPGPAHFIKKGNQVFVTGRVAISAVTFTNGTRTMYALSLPFPAASPAYPDGAAGILTATQQGTHVNVSGYVTTVPAGLVVFIYNATAAGNCNTYFSFSYTAQ